MKTVAEMAREAGSMLELGEPHGDMVLVLERFAALVRADEREACAKDWESRHGYDKYGVAAAIRARGQDPMPLFDDWGGIPYKSCPPCNQQCNQGRDCPNA